MLKIKVFFIISVFFVLGACGVCVANYLDYSKNVSVQSSSISTEVKLKMPEFISHKGDVPAMEVNQNKSVSDDVKKNNNNLKNYKYFMLYVALFVVIVMSLSIFGSLFMLFRKISELNKNINFTKNYTLDKTIENLNEFTETYKNSFNVNELELNPEKLSKEIEDLVEDIKEEEQNKVEIIPLSLLNDKNEEDTVPLTQINSQYVQKESPYVNKVNLSQIEPVVLSSEDIDNQKGFYLVEYDYQKSLIGYIKDEIFLIGKLNNQQTGNLKVKLTEQIGNKSIYMVKSGRYKALVQVDSEKMKLLLEM